MLDSRNSQPYSHFNMIANNGTWRHIAYPARASQGQFWQTHSFSLPDIHQNAINISIYVHSLLFLAYITATKIGWLVSFIALATPTIYLHSTYTYVMGTMKISPLNRINPQVWVIHEWNTRKTLEARKVNSYHEMRWKFDLQNSFSLHFLRTNTRNQVNLLIFWSNIL